MRKGLKKKFTKLLLRHYLNVPSDWIIALGTPFRKGMPFAAVYSEPLWQEENLTAKVRSVLRRHWLPSEERIQKVADDVFIENIFGGNEDYGDKLLNLMTWHYQQPPPATALPKADEEKAYSLQVFTQSTRDRFKDLHFARLRLQLAVRSPMICTLAFPMVIKIPILAIRYYVDIDYQHAFAAIRKSGHPQAEGLVAYLYETAFIQQKIAIGFHEYLRLVRHTREHKEQAILTKGEVDALREMDNVLSLLKASLEKMIALLGLAHGITNLTEQKTHTKKVAALKKRLPEATLSLEYWKLIEEFISPENLEVLNNFRNGLLHKRGISALQPHSYVGKPGKDTPFDEIFQPLHEQHAKNTMVFLCTLAILTDQLVRLDPPSMEEQLAFYHFASQADPIPHQFMPVDES